MIIERKKVRIDLDVTWPSHKFQDGRCRARHLHDPVMPPKANNIHKSYLIRGLHMTLEVFTREYRSNLNKNDSIEYFAQKSFDRWNKRLISDETYEKEKGTLKKVKSFMTVLLFYEFTTNWAQEFDNHLKRKFSNDHNTRWARHKHVKAYLNMAKDIDRINFNDPYARFKNTLQEGSWKPLK